MDKITLLVPVRRMPDRKSVDIMLIRNLIPKLNSKFDVNLVWVVAIPESKKNKFPVSKDEKVVFFYDYNNAVDILDEIKPNLVIARPSLEPVNYALLLACKKKGILLITSFLNRLEFKDSTSKMLPIKTHFHTSISGNVRGESDSSNNKPFRGLEFFLKKYSFLLRTLKKFGYTRYQNLKFSLFYYKHMFSSYSQAHPSFSGNLNLCSIDEDVVYLNKCGIFKNIKKIGNPTFDELFREFQNVKTNKVKNNDKIKILFCTNTFHEHGLVSAKKETELILDVIKATYNNEDFDIDVKIHPTSSIMSEYEELLKNFKGVTIFQKEDLMKLLPKYDLMITYGWGSVIYYGVLSKMKMVYIPFFEKSSQTISGVKEGISVECKNPKDVVKYIQLALQNQINQKLLDEYIKNNFGIFDGNCTERIIDEIMSILPIHKN